MPRHKTAHRKALEAQNKEKAALRAAVVAELAASNTLKPNAVASVPKGSKKK